MGSMRKVVVFCAGLLMGAALMLVSQNVMAVGDRTVEDFSQFIKRIDDGAIKEVTYTGGAEISYVTTEGKRLVTAAPQVPFTYVGLTEKLLVRGVAVKSKQ